MALDRSAEDPEGFEAGGAVSLAELRRVNKMRRDFVANVSHELKTPATSLKLLAESLSEILEDDPEQAAFSPTSSRTRRSGWLS